MTAGRHGDASAAPQLEALTGIRGLAALYVLMLHLNMAIGSVDFGDYVAPLHDGYLGVDLFFVLSGFIISHVYTRDFARWSIAGYRRFLWFRLARLYPVHLLTIAILIIMVAGAGLLGVAINQPDNWSFAALPLHVLLIHAWGFSDTATWNTPAWSISAEWMAYIFFPFVVIRIRRVRGAAAGLFLSAGLLVAMAVLFRSAGWSVDSAWVGAPALSRVSFEFLIGCLLYRVHAAVARSSVLWDVVGILALAAYLWVATYASDDFVQIGLIAIFVLAASRSLGVVRHFLASRPMMLLGEISYSIYMIHFAVILVLMRVIDWMGWRDAPPLTALAIFAASIVLVCVLSLLSYRLVERPGRAFLKSRRLGAPATAPAE